MQTSYFVFATLLGTYDLAKNMKRKVSIQKFNSYVA